MRQPCRFIKSESQEWRNFDILFGMGTYHNEGNRLYRQSVNSEIHVNKSLLIRETNKRLDTDDKYICLSRL